MTEPHPVEPHMPGAGYSCSACDKPHIPGCIRDRDATFACPNMRADTPAPAVPLDGPRLVDELRNAAGLYEECFSGWKEAEDFRALADEIEDGLLADRALFDRLRARLDRDEQVRSVIVHRLPRRAGKYAARFQNDPNDYTGDSPREALSRALPEGGV
jgi:hypothetical protein